MDKEIPMLSARIINRVEDYEQHYHTRAYVRQKSDSFGTLDSNREKVQELMNTCGYKDFEKFCAHRQAWDALIGEVPLVYLDAIGVELEAIDLIVETDQEEYRKVLQIPRYPKAGTVRLMGGFYRDFKFPDNTPEADAILMLQEYSHENNLQCCINYRDILTIWIQPDGRITHAYYKPSFRLARRYVVFSTSKDMVGKVRIR